MACKIGTISRNCIRFWCGFNWGRGMQHLIVAPCTRRKRVQIEPALRASTLEPGTLRCVAQAWVARLQKAPWQVRAERLYAGRGIVEARRAATAIGAGFHIVSAGVGLIDGRQEIPAYSLTVGVGDNDSVASKVVDVFSPGLWWDALHGALGRPGGVLAPLVQACDGLVILALPGTYLKLIANELAFLPSEALARIRLIGPPMSMVSPGLTEVWMPYDARFESAVGPGPGTRSDFAQRAVRHFAEMVVYVAPGADAATHARMVERCLNALKPPSQPHREAGTDAELIGVIRELLPKSGGLSGKTLRLLRHGAGRACEQGRFRRLFAAATRADLVQ